MLNKNLKNLTFLKPKKVNIKLFSLRAGSTGTMIKVCQRFYCTYSLEPDQLKFPEPGKSGSASLEYKSNVCTYYGRKLIYIADHNLLSLSFTVVFVYHHHQFCSV